MTGTAVRFVDVYPIRIGSSGLEALILRRAAGVRCAGAWEAVHGRIEAAETPVAAALRELQEETGLVPQRYYNLSRVESFYLHLTDEVALIPSFAAVIDSVEAPVLSHEHDRWSWLPLEQAIGQVAWPRERRALADIGVLLRDGTAGPLEDVLRLPLDSAPDSR
ncbi:MAG: NUDIX domain-containing protein [Gemmatimonadales bacterium]|nr:NUDIX domain-containing protein [Gemmatimonadales bacterium]